MYRKFKEHKDNEYETIIRRQVNESKLIAEQEGISIPKTLDDYVAPSRAGAAGNKNGKKTLLSLSSHEDYDDLGIDVSLKKEKRLKIFANIFLRMMIIKWLIWPVEMMMMVHTMIAIN
jgi:hypothetical protein